MVRIFVAALLLWLTSSEGWAQTPSPAAPAAATPPARSAATPTRSPAVKKGAPKAKTANQPPEPVVTGPCQLGLIAAIEDSFTVQKIGITVFGNELTEVPVDWGYNEIVVARVRAAAAGMPVRRIAFAKGAFDPYYKPPETLFRIPRDVLTPIVQHAAGDANCERYLLVTTSNAAYGGTNQTLNGIGVLDGQGPFGHPILFINIQLTMYDGKSFEKQRIPVDFATVLSRSLLGEKPNPLSRLSDADYPRPAAAAAQNAMLHDRIRTLLAEQLDKALPAYLKAE
jgi:hypothetical protein